MKKGDEVEVVRKIRGFPPIGSRGTLVLIDPKDKKYPYYVEFSTKGYPWLADKRGATVWKAFRVNEIKAVKK